jgi:hypothetical protein
MVVWGIILLRIVGLFILSVVIFAAVKNGIDKSVVGQLIKTKYWVKDEIVPVSDDEIEKELEDGINEK